MNETIYRKCLTILHEELIPALGCTEPIAVAYAAAKARALLDAVPESMTVSCSGNIIKNVMGVVVPNSGGMRGIAVAALLGMLGGNEDSRLSALESVTDEHIRKMHELYAAGFCECRLVEGVENLYVKVELRGGGHSSCAEIQNRHTNITMLEKDGVRMDCWQKLPEHATPSSPTETQLTVRDILEFADTVEISDIAALMQRQIDCNMAIAEEGLSHAYGAAVGATLLERNNTEIINLAKAHAAAASDARMGGCALPVVINSGSGNQGITASVPVICFARSNNIPQEKLYRALALSNLLATHQKQFVGRLSAYCGAVSAASGSGAAITYLSGGSYEQISGTIINTIATIGGMVCDGAKASCASKIAAAVETAFLAHQMSMAGRVFQPGEGLVRGDIEKTVRSVCRMAREGMRETDVEILHIMLGE